MINGEGKLPPRIPTAAPPYKPRALEPVKLRKMDHDQWLKNFSETLAMNSRVEMTPFRMGAITRLAWASDYIKLLEADVLRLEGRVAEISERISVESDDKILDEGR